MNQKVIRLNKKKNVSIFTQEFKIHRPPPPQLRPDEFGLNDELAAVQRPKTEKELRFEKLQHEDYWRMEKERMRMGRREDYPEY